MPASSGGARAGRGLRPRLLELCEPLGVVLADRHLALEDARLYGDVVEFGEWECSGDRVSFLDGRFEADVIEEDGRLVLDRNGTRYLEN